MEHTVKPVCIAVLGAVLFSVIGLSGCSQPSAMMESQLDDDGGSTAEPEPPAANAKSTPQPTVELEDEFELPTDELPAELLADMDAAVAAVDQWWATHWSEYFTESYASPVVVGLYDGDDPSTAPMCADQVLGPGNAFYCPVNDSVQWDDGLMLAGFEEGDAWPYLVIAHEWGHAIQARLSAELVSSASELQADCLAGAVIYGSAADGVLLFERGDQKEIAVGLGTLGDETAWTDSDDHGDPFERVEAFNTGRKGGVPACFPVE